MSILPTDNIISCFYNSSEDCVKVIATDGTLLSLNPNGLKIMEIDNEKDILGKDWLNFWHGHLQKKANSALEKVSRGELANFEGYCPTFKGTMKYWEVTLAPLFADNGDVQWILVTSRDMTKYRDLRKELISVKRELALLVHTVKLATASQNQLS